MALYYIGGILKHAKALAAFTNPTTNSYRRLVPGYEAPVNLAYSSAQPLGVDPHPDVLGPRRRRAASRSASPTRRCNPYLAFAAMMMAGLDGIQNKIDPGDPLDKDIYALSPEELKDVPAHAGLARRGARRAREATTSSSSGATSSRRTSSTSGSTTSGRRRSTRSACARRRTSSSSTTTFRELVAMKVRAAIAYEADKPLVVEEVELEGPKAGEVLVEIKATGVCHTDEFTRSRRRSRGALPRHLRPRGRGRRRRRRRRRDDAARRATTSSRSTRPSAAPASRASAARPTCARPSARRRARA